MKYKLGYTEEECVAMEKEKRKGGGDQREGDGTMWQCMENPAALSAAVFHRSFQFRNALAIPGQPGIPDALKHHPRFFRPRHINSGPPIPLQTTPQPICIIWALILVLGT